METVVAVVDVVDDDDGRSEGPPAIGSVSAPTPVSAEETVAGMDDEDDPLTIIAAISCTASDTTFEGFFIRPCVVTGKG